MKTNRSFSKFTFGTLVLGASLSAYGAEFTVDQTIDGVDANPGDGICATSAGDCTLRAAVMETNALSGADTITLPAGAFAIALGSTGEDLAAEGDLDILDDLTVTGAGRTETEISGNFYSYRVFSVLKRDDATSPVVTISNLSLAKGLLNDNAALVHNEADLTLDNVSVSDAGSESSAIYNTSELTISNSQINSNFRGIYSNSGNVTVSDTTFDQNVASGHGSALYQHSGTGFFTNSIFTNNEALDGGAIYSRGSVEIDSSQFEGNAANKNGYAYGHGGAVYASIASITNTSFIDNTAEADGGALQIGSQLTVEDSRFEENAADGHGGAIMAGGGILKLVESDFTSNTAGERGGAVYADVSDTLLTSIRVSNNTAGTDGGGLLLSTSYGTGSVEASNSKIVNNSASRYGGGIFLNGYSNGEGKISYSQISNNSADYGGGLYSNIGDVVVRNTTIASNTVSTDGGGIYQQANASYVMELVHTTLADNIAPMDTAANIKNVSGGVRLRNTLLSENSTAVNCSGTISTLGYNLSSDDTCGLGVEGDQANTDPLLGSLQDNGGDTQTMALGTGSPAIDAGNAVLCASYNPIDQRYFYRGDDACDIGAYEADSVRAQSGTLAFSVSNFEFDEDVETATLTVSRTDGSEGAVSVTLLDSAKGDATASNYSYGDYYTISETALEWADGDENDKTLDITINEDTTSESDETIALELESATVKGGASLGLKEATVTILDNDVPGEAQFSVASIEVEEDAYSVQVLVERVDGTIPVQISYATSDGTAIAGTDYGSASGTLYFNEGDTSESFYVYIYDNDLYEESNKTFNVELSNPQNGLKLGSPSTAVVTILENEVAPEAGEVSFSVTEYSVDENGGYVQVAVSREGGNVDVSVDYSTSDGTAIAGSDYITVSGTLEFTGDQSNETFRVYISEDTEVEGDETINLTLSNQQGGVILGNSSAVITIEDNDTNTGPDPEPGAESGVIQFSASSVSYDEDEGSVSIAVARTAGSDGLVTVSFRAVSDSAVPGADYVLDSGTLSFAEGVTSQTITLSIQNDDITEDTESFVLQLHSPTNDAELGANASLLVTIVDDEGETETPSSDLETIQFSVSEMEVQEDDGIVSITVIRTGDSDGTVSVDYQAVSNTASYGLDFVLGSGSLVFAEGVTSRTITLSILDNTIEEDTESFSVRLTDADSSDDVELGNVSEIQVRINDNDHVEEESSESSGGAINPLMLLAIAFVAVVRRRRVKS